MEDLGSVELRVGDEHRVRLKGLATAGYLWSAKVEGDSTAASAKEVDEEPAGAADHPALGESRDEVFVVRALAAGRATVRFVQRRPWEEGPPARESVLEIEVRA